MCWKPLDNTVYLVRTKLETGAKGKSVFYAMNEWGHQKFLSQVHARQIAIKIVLSSAIKKVIHDVVNPF